MDTVAAGVTLVEQPRQGPPKGVTGLDSGCRGRGSGPRKATMISKTNNVAQHTSADNSPRAYALAA
ncbi:MAG: hypothetical protein JWN17_171 [Frankiales bacterium]|nr:hypothetical protein [Frankiales bacterium]